MSSKLLLGLVVIIAGLGIGWYVLGGGNLPYRSTPSISPTQQVTETAPPTSEETSSPAAMTGASESGGVMEKVTVSYKESGFVPATVTVKKGMTVRFVNQSAGRMWVASDVHPTHQLLPGFDELKGVSRGEAYEYTFVKVGTWRYHNHLDPSITGTVVVTE